MNQEESKRTSRICALIGAVFCALGVMAGAFGAHALRGYVDEYSLAIFEKGVFYHLIHSLGILSVASLGSNGTLNSRGTGRLCFLMAFGIVVFSGSLYCLSISGLKWLGAITPVGGTAFIAAWLLLAWQLRRA